MENCLYLFIPPRLFILFFVVVVLWQNIDAAHSKRPFPGLFLRSQSSRGGSAQCPLEWPVVIFLGLLNMVHLTLAKIDDYTRGGEARPLLNGHPL